MNRYKQVVSRVPDNIDVERNSLCIPDNESIKSGQCAARTHSAKRTGFTVWGRYAAIAAAVVILLTGGVMMWNYLFGGSTVGSNGDDELVMNLPGSSSVFEEDYMLSENYSGDTTTKYVFGKNSEEFTIEYRVISGHYIEGTEPVSKLIESEGDLRAFIEEYEILEGQRYGDTVCDLPDTVDFSKKAVIAAVAYDSSTPVYLSPVFFDDYYTDPYMLGISIRTEPYEKAADDILLRGYFIIVERTYIDKMQADKNGQRFIYHTDPAIFDFTADDCINITPSNLLMETDIRVYQKNGGVYLVQPDTVVITSSNEFNGIGVTSIHAYAAEDFSHIIYTYKRYNNEAETTYSYISVCFLGQPMKFIYSEAYQGDDIVLVRTEDNPNRYAVYKAEQPDLVHLSLFAYVSILPDDTAVIEAYTPD